MNNRHSLLAAIQHHNMRDGEVTIRLGGEYYVAHITHFEYKATVGDVTTVRIEGVVKK